jgi:hypothetical protein
MLFAASVVKRERDQRVIGGEVYAKRGPMYAGFAPFNRG